MRSFAVTKETAAGARQVGMPTHIDEKGAYKGKLILAEAVKSKSGTEGIEFRFRTDDGRTADYLTVWTHKEDGTELSGARLVSAMMVCLQVRNTSPQRASVKKWDSAQRAEVQVNAEVYAELMGKPIGLLLYREEYEKSDGGTAWKNGIAAPFHYETDRTAAEVLDQKPAGEALPKMIEALRDRPLKGRKPANGGGGHAGNGAARQQSSFSDMDDDIPF